MAITISGSGTITGLSAGGLPNDSVTSANIADSAITTPKIANGAVVNDDLATAVKPVGVGQTWQDLTGSRSVGVTYTNTTGRPIVVCVNGYGSTGANPVRIIVDGVIVTRFEPIALGNACAIVPSGSTYIYYAPNGTTAIVELR